MTYLYVHIVICCCFSRLSFIFSCCCLLSNLLLPFVELFCYCSQINQQIKVLYIFLSLLRAGVRLSRHRLPSMARLVVRRVTLPCSSPSVSANVPQVLPRSYRRSPKYVSRARGCRRSRVVLCCDRGHPEEAPTSGFVRSRQRNARHVVWFMMVFRPGWSK